MDIKNVKVSEGFDVAADNAGFKGYFLVFDKNGKLKADQPQTLPFEILADDSIDGNALIEIASRFDGDLPQAFIDAFNYKREQLRRS